MRKLYEFFKVLQFQKQQLYEEICHMFCDTSPPAFGKKMYVLLQKPSYIENNERETLLC